MFYASLAALIAAIVGLDQWVKWLTIQHIPENTVGEPVLGLFRLAHHRNTGAAWSMLEGQTWFFIGVLVVFIGALIFMIRKEWINKKPEFVALAMILGGALGNAGDRIFRGGEVVDMIKFNFWLSFPTFNVADIFITVGCAFLMVYVLFFDKEEGRKLSKD
ncbi:MAG: signal peptidase II [Oscillospiraceae bacterium]|nr:signal peptidase II [Oscillospiraceae bacterium]